MAGRLKEGSRLKEGGRLIGVRLYASNFNINTGEKIEI